LAKIAGTYGIPPLIYAGTTATGASFVLLVMIVLKSEKIILRKEELRYAIIAGQLTFSVPFGTLAAVIPLIGSAVPAIFQSMTPIITLGIVWVAGLERPNLLRSLGLVIGFAGTLLILYSREGISESSGTLQYYLFALVTPLSLAIGNVFRTTSWPQGSKSLSLAMLTLAAAASGLLLVAVFFKAIGLLTGFSAGLSAGWYVPLIQALLMGIGYAMFFRLQQVGGPVYLSQISYVNTGVGVLFAVLVFGERLPLQVWISAICVFAGISLVTLSNKLKAYEPRSVPRIDSGSR
jgi:drug/metabolite transporter (DMT)-like permease